MLAAAVATETPFAPFAVPLRHAGAGGQHHPDHPDADCDACLLYMAVHGDHAGMAVIPRGAELPAISVAGLVARLAAAPTTQHAGGSIGAWARAPRATT